MEILYFTSRRSEKENKAEEWSVGEKGQETGKNGRNRGKHVKLGEKRRKIGKIGVNGMKGKEMVQNVGQRPIIEGYWGILSNN